MTRPNDATQRQIEAADPTQSTWLSANAGSGKTRVLTDRVARLLLSGTRPENILCLTYTKAAASEMQNRLFQRLGAWAMMPNADLRKSLSELGADTNLDDGFLRQARRLFASAIETPGGLKIQTIHSFCAGILRRFPLEAGVSPSFQEIEDRAAQMLREEVLNDMASGPDAQVLRDFAAYFTGSELDRFLGALTARKAMLLDPDAENKVLDRLELSAESTLKDAVSIAFIGGENDLTEHMVQASADASPSYQKTAKALNAIKMGAPDLDTLNAVAPHLLYADRSSKSRNWPDKRHKKAVDAFAPLIDDIHAWMDRVATAHDHMNRVRALGKTRSLFAFARPFITAYETRKLQRGALDFDDLITKARALLEDPAVAQWVLFRLDGGVDHVLVDEAQDTSPDQWEIVRLLTQEFSTGQGAQADRERTVFVVGDMKQSIYSFQGADPEGFDRMRRHFERELGHVDKTLQNRELLYSFRSSPAILQLVDETFRDEMAEGLGDRIAHLAFHDQMPGRVDLWPVVEPVAGPEEREWDDPIDQKGRTNHTVVLARQIASDIKRMLAEETLPVLQKDDKGWARRPITPGDFLILVQRRGDLFREIIAACKSAGLDIAGADVLKLGAELAVKDISALLNFIALQDDDLSLAAALRSPLLGWSEADLYHLAQPRPKGQTLWEALRQSQCHARTVEILTDLRDRADFLRPYDLINRVLITHDGRRHLLARLGHEAEDGIDALLSQALAYERSDIPSLTGFLSWLQTEEVTIKRQVDAASDRIRVMTVHGAKGLEAPIVILPDTAKRKRDLKGELLIQDEQLFWKPSKEAMPDVLGGVRDAMLDAQDRERRRLLYVALTRAEQWLIVAAAGDVGDGTSSWHGTISGAFDHLDAETLDGPYGPIRRFARWNWADGPLIEAQTQPSPAPAVISFGDNLPEPKDMPAVLSPSDLGGAKIMPGETDSDQSDMAMAYGTAVHALLEVLPELRPDMWEQRATQLIDTFPDSDLLSSPDAAIEEAISVLRAPDLAWVFENGLSEVPITAVLDSLGGRRISGIIDRLIVTETEVFAIDFKTNRIAPNNAQQTPDGLVRQMAAYRDALKQIFPNHQVRVSLLWTGPAKLTELSDAQLDTALIPVSCLDGKAAQT